MDFTDYIRPELLVLIPVLNVIGALLKSSSKNNKSPIFAEDIPLWLSGISVALSLLYVAATALEANEVMNWPQAIFTAITQGVMIAGTSVFAHQVMKK